MYGWLNYDPTDQQPPSGSVDGIHILYASTAVPGVPSALCERCMPRWEGDFLFCWTAMSGSWA